jgi:Tfp pilus assembly protein PilN
MLRAHYRIGQAVGISIHLHANGEVAVNACSIVVKGSKLDIDKKITDLKNIDDLKKHFPQKTLVSLNLFGKGILQKQVDRLDEINPNTLAQILPNGNPEDFYVQNFVSGESSFVSIIRRADADKWIDAVKNLGFTPLSLSLGPFPFQSVIEHLNFYDEDIVFDGHIIKRNTSKAWTGYSHAAGSTTGFLLKISTEAINEKLVLPYAVAFQLALSPDIEVIEANVDALQAQLQNELSNKKLRVKGFLVLVAFFILLLINFIAFSWLTATNNQLSELISVSARSVNDMEGITDHVKTNEALLKTLGWDDGINKAALIDQLASLTPDDIRLLEMRLNSIDGAATRTQRSLSFYDRTIKLVGSSQNILPVNEWMARIKTLKWIKTIQMDSYTFNTELGSGQFTITLTY